MSWWNARGMAGINARNPRAVGQCDCCGWTYSLQDLRYQMQYAGQKIINTHFRVCPTCYDIPSVRQNPYAIAPDPVPVKDPRLEDYAAESKGSRGPAPWPNGSGS